MATYQHVLPGMQAEVAASTFASLLGPTRPSIQKIEASPRAIPPAPGALCDSRVRDDRVQVRGALEVLQLSGPHDREAIPRLFKV